MLFNSLEFAVFLPVLFILYWFCFNEKLKSQNAIVLVSSYVFYGFWDYRFLFLILFSTVVDYVLGRALEEEKNHNKRKVILLISISVNLGLLSYFKYCNFFIESFSNAFTFFGNPLSITSLDIVLPVGISFYTFQTMSYTIDIYKKKLKPSSDFISFAAFVSFFPQLVAGPIERASNLLPQFNQKRVFKYESATDGMRQILWGLFKKMVIADMCAEQVNIIFENSATYSGSTLLLGAFLFSFQIYGDFSGYSDIAIGTSRLFGFNLMKNFSFPYFSRDIGEFWRRWHISLSTWFRDYLYFPLGGSKEGLVKNIRNVFIIFIVSGFWHGSSWTFVIWGGIHALFFTIYLIFRHLKFVNAPQADVVSQNRLLPSFVEIFQMLFTFIIVMIGWVFFRAETLSQAYLYICEMCSMTLFSKPEIIPTVVLLLLSFFIIIEWFGRRDEFAIEKIGLSWKRPIRWFLYVYLIFLIGMFMQTDETPFIYFQF